MKRAMAGLLLLLTAGPAACSGDSGDSAAAAEQTPAEAAIDVCRQSVERKLKAPATAEFSDETTEALGSNDDHFEVQGHVDAENGFGALIRMVWRCDAELQSNGRWSVESEVR